jgi:two-component system cell cycle sensor histidine kinase/response regulator CckA
MTPLIHVLYVDDSPLDRELVRDALEQEHDGFRLTEASSHQEFEARLQEGGFDLVLSDFNILGFEGLQVIKAVKAKDPYLPVIIVTGTGSEEIAVEAMRSGASDYVIKTPGHIQRLPITIQKVLEKRQLRVEKARAEKALAEEVIRRRILVGQSRDGIVVLDETGKVYEANQRYAEMLGYTPEELSQLYVWDWDVQWTREELLAKIRDIDVAGDHLETRHRRKDGTIVDVEISTNGAVLGGQKLVFCVCRDISQRKAAELALRESEEKYRLLVDQIPAVVFRGYADGSIDTFDRKIETLTGYPKEDFDSRRRLWSDLILAEDLPAAKNEFVEGLRTTGAYEKEYRIRKKSGEIIWVQVHGQIFLDGAGRIAYVNGVIFDITERKGLEDQLFKAQRMEAVGILAGGVAHDFNNLLTAIMGYGEIMMLGLRQEDPFFPYIEEIIKAANRGGKLTHQLLAFSRKQILQPRVVNLNDVVKDMDGMLRRLIGEDIDLLAAIDQHLGFIQADPGQIEQIIMNLAINARDAMPKGGKLTIETANVFLDQPYARSHMEVLPGPYVMLAMSDNGLGMDAGTIARIYEPFFTTKEEGKGTGLGLATVYGIVKQSGGHIWVYSEPGQGTTFKIYLPRVEQGDVEVEVKATAPTPLEGTETILVVEDDAALRELISTALRKYGFSVLEAGHGGEALLICENEKASIHLMLTDVVMPQISGRALAERLAGFHPEMKVLFMSGYTGDAIVHHGVLDSGLNFIQKPFKILSLIEKVREVLGAVAPS